MRAVDAADLGMIQDNLVRLKVWIEHWQADLASNVTPTETSLASAHTLTAISLAAIKRIEQGQAKERAA